MAHQAHNIAWKVLAKQMQKFSQKDTYLDEKQLKYFASTVDKTINDFAETEMLKYTNISPFTKKCRISPMKGCSGVSEIEQEYVAKMDGLPFKVWLENKKHNHTYEKQDMIEYLKVLIHHGKIQTILNMIKGGLDISKFYHSTASMYYNAGLGSLVCDYNYFYVIINLAYLHEVDANKVVVWTSLDRPIAPTFLNNVLPADGNCPMIMDQCDYKTNQDSVFYKDMVTKSFNNKLTWSDWHTFAKYLFRIWYTMKMIDNFNRKTHKSPQKILPGNVKELIECLFDRKFSF